MTQLSSEVADTVHDAVKSMQVSLKERLKTQKQPEIENVGPQVCYSRMGEFTGQGSPLNPRGFWALHPPMTG